MIFYFDIKEIVNWNLFIYRTNWVLDQNISFILLLALRILLFDSLVLSIVKCLRVF